MKATLASVLFALILSSCASAEMVGRKPNVIPNSNAVCVEGDNRGWSPGDPNVVLMAACDVKSQYRVPMDPSVQTGLDCRDNYVFIPPAGLRSTVNDPTTYQVLVNFSAHIQNNGNGNETVCMDNQCWSVPPNKPGQDYPIAWSDWTYWRPSLPTNCDANWPNGFGCGVQGLTTLQNGFGICAAAGNSDLVVTQSRTVAMAVPCPTCMKQTTGANR